MPIRKWPPTIYADPAITGRSDWNDLIDYLGGPNPDPLLSQLLLADRFALPEHTAIVTTPHVTDLEKAAWNAKLSPSDHSAITTTPHVTNVEKAAWDAKASVPVAEADVDFDATAGHHHTGVDSKAVGHGDLGNVSSGQHHAKSHAHDGADGSGQVAHGSLTGVSATQHHSNANDPTADEKAALAGDPGPASATNKYITSNHAGVKSEVQLIFATHEATYTP